MPVANSAYRNATQKRNPGISKSKNGTVMPREMPQRMIEKETKFVAEEMT